MSRIGDHSAIYKSDEADGNITIYQGDVFLMPIIPMLSNFDLIWDRAAMVAINPCDRAKYGAKIKSILAKNGKVLIECLHREEGRTGPPHTLTEAHLTEVYKPLGFQLNHLSTHEDLSSIDRLGRLEVHNYLIKQ